MIQAFTNEDFQRLDEWLLRRPTGLLDAVMLEGFLTAIVIGPNTLLPSAWWPKVFGGRKPHFRNEEEFRQAVDWVMRFYNDIAMHFETDPGGFEPTFYESKMGRKRVLIVDEWCEGFMKGMRLDAAGWKPLARERPELLRPFRLFGTRAGWKELAAGGEGKLHTQWSVRVAPAVRDIYAFWLPRRRAQLAPGDAEGRLH